MEFDILSLAFVAFMISHAGGRLQVITSTGHMEEIVIFFFFLIKTLNVMN